METPTKGRIRDVMETPTRKLVRKTENAIQQYLTTDWERNMPIIEQLEDVSYQLWVESNTAFLDESLVTSCAEEDDDWQWDEECFFDSSTNQADTCDDNISTCSFLDSCSSIGSSIKPCDETDCSIGYLASCESDISELSTYVRLGMPYQSDTPDDWVIVDVDSKLDNDNDWIVLSKAPDSDCDWIKTNSIEHGFEYVEVDIQEPNDIVTGSQDHDGDDDNDIDDWAVLSMKITEVFKSRDSHVLDHSVVSRDSGTKSPETCCSKSCYDFPGFSDHVRHGTSDHAQHGVESSLDFRKYCAKSKDDFTEALFDISTCNRCRQSRGEWIILCLYNGKAS